MKNYICLILIFVVFSCNNRTVMIGEQARSLQSCYSHVSSHAIVWSVENKIRGAVVNFEAGAADEDGNIKVETSERRELSRQGTSNANPKIRKINQNTFLATWTSTDNTRLLARYVQQTGSGLSVDAGSAEFVITSGTIFAYDLEIIGNSIVVAVHKKEKIEIYSMDKPEYPPFTEAVSLVGAIGNSYSTRYSSPSIHITGGVINNIISWTNNSERIIYTTFSSIPASASAILNFIEMPKLKSLHRYYPCFDFVNKKYVFAMQLAQNIAGRQIFEVNILALNAETGVKSDFSKIKLFEAPGDGFPAPDAFEKEREVRNLDKNCVACKEKYQLSHEWEFKNLIGLSNYSKESARLVLVFESITTEITQTNSVFNVDKVCAGGYIPAGRCISRSFPTIEKRQFKQNYYTFINYLGETTLSPYKLLSEDDDHQTISDDPASFQVFTSVAPNNGTPFITVKRIQ